MKKDGISFVKLRDGWNAGKVKGNWLVNGVEPTVCRGDADWCQVAGDITSIQRINHKSDLLDHWKLKEQYASFPLEKTRHADAFERYDDDDPNAAFYEAVYVHQEPVITTEEFEVIDYDCEPIARPAYVTVKFPHTLSEYPDTWHKWPCEINYKAVFEIVAEAVVTRCKELPDYVVTDHRNIQALKVERRISIPQSAQVAERENYWPSFRSRNMKSRMVKKTTRLIKVLDLIGEYKGGHGEIRTVALSGDNWAELSENLSNYVQSFVDLLDPEHLEVCEHCKGSGVVKAEKVTA